MDTEINLSTAVILAAGKGTRMQSDLPKVMHPIASQPMLGHVIRAAEDAGCKQIVVVVAPDMPEVQNYARTINPEVIIAVQNEQLGTGDAVACAQSSLKGEHGNVLVLFGDSPLVRAETLETMLRTLSKDPKQAVTVLGFDTETPGSYGRLVLNETGALERIVEAKDANKDQLGIRLCNAGAMAIRGTMIWDLLARLDNRNSQAEYYLPDVVVEAQKMGYRCGVVRGQKEDALGVNSRNDQATAECVMQNRLRDHAMAQGVTMISPETVFLAADTEFGYDVTIQPHVFFGPEVVVGDGVEIRAYSHIEGAVIGDYSVIGPFARVRPGTNIGVDCKIGNFVELKKAEVEHGAKISHLSYIGDAHVGENANIGAGTITCNYDGFKKYHTEIGRDAFIGSNTALVAPVVVGAGAYVGAGSVVTENVKADSLVVARSRQSQKDEWAKDFRQKMEEEEESEE